MQLYNLEGQPMEQIPDGSPVPPGRWATPTGGRAWQQGIPDTASTPIPTSAMPFGTTNGESVVPSSTTSGWPHSNNSSSWYNPWGSIPPQEPAAQPIAPVPTATSAPTTPFSAPQTSTGALGANSFGAFDPQAYITSHPGIAISWGQDPGYASAYGNIQNYARADALANGSPQDKIAAQGYQAPTSPTNANGSRNLTGETSSTLADQIALAPQQYSAYATYSPLYAQTDLNNTKNLLFGQNNPILAQHPEYGNGLLGINQALTDASNQQTVSGNTAIRTANINDAYNLGGQALQAQYNLNTPLYQNMDQLDRMARDGQATSQWQRSLGDIFSNGPQYQNVGANPIGSTYNVSAPNNPLLGFASQQATSSQGTNSPLVNDLTQSAQQQLALGSGLSEEQQRNAQQAAREAWGARGLINSNGAVGAEVLNRDAYGQQLLAQRQGFAQNVAQLGQSQQNLGNQYMLGLIGAGSTQGAQNLQAQMANQSTGLSAQQSNQSTGLQAQLANQGAFGQAQQQQIGLGSTLTGLDYGHQQQNFGNLLSASQQRAATAFNPFSTVLGPTTSNQGQNSTLFNQAPVTAANGQQIASNAFNPFNSYASDLYNTNYNAQSAQQIAAANNAAAQQSAKTTSNGALLGAGIGAAGAIGGALIVF